MKSECDKCGYKTSKLKSKLEKQLCDFCSHFAPESEDEYNSYINEKVNWREIQTYRKQGKIGGIKQKRGMKEKARKGHIVSRAPFGYKITNNHLVPNENSHVIEELYEEFLESNISLNRLSKKHGLSVNGLKKVLTNFTYIGKIKFDKEVHEGKHKPLISTTLFNHVQDKLASLKIKIN